MKFVSTKDRADGIRELTLKALHACCCRYQLTTPIRPGQAWQQIQARAQAGAAPVDDKTNPGMMRCRLVQGLFWAPALGSGHFFTADGGTELRLWAVPTGANRRCNALRGAPPKWAADTGLAAIDAVMHQPASCKHAWTSFPGHHIPSLPPPSSV